MSDVTLSITGMSCGHCVAAVTKALKSVEGVSSEEVRIGSARVSYDASKVSPSQIAQAVTEEGYLAQVAA